MPFSDTKKNLNKPGREPGNFESGFTIIEIILSILVFSILGVVSAQYITSIAGLNQLNTAHTNVMEDAATALEFMTREVRDADESVNSIRCTAALVNCVVGVTYTDEFTFDKQLETPVDSLRRDTNASDINYSFSGGQITRTSNSISTVLLDGVTSFEFTEMSTGLYKIVLTVTDGDNVNFTVRSAVRSRNAQLPLTLALVVADTGSLDANTDTPLNNHLTTTLGHNVDLKGDDDTTWTPSNYDAVIISASSVDTEAAFTGTFLRDAAVGLMTVDGSTGNELDLSTSAGSETGPSKEASLTSVGHFITQTFSSTGTQTPAIHSPNSNQGHMNGFANDVTMLANHVTGGGSGKAHLLYCENGGTLAGGVNTAQGRRVFMGAQYFANLSSNGIILFNRSLAWITNDET